MESYNQIFKDRKPETVTQIINQNTINNYIIQNPEKVEVIEYGPAQAQPIPDLKPTTLISLHTQSQNASIPTEQIAKKVIPPKKVSFYLK